jgi:hypothetical protein
MNAQAGAALTAVPCLDTARQARNDPGTAVG